jgi:hypothetical protein
MDLEVQQEIREGIHPCATANIQVWKYVPSVGLCSVLISTWLRIGSVCSTGHVQTLRYLSCAPADQLGIVAYNILSQFISVPILLMDFPT